MRRILLLCLTAVFTLASSELWAQERTVSGRVTSTEDGSPLPGVNVVLKGTTNGAVTDAEGAFSLNVPSAGGTLVFTFIGLKSQEVEVGTRTTIDVSMEQDATQLSEVVVTALGIKREVKTLPYASQQVDSKQLNMTRANNVNDALAGKVAGVQVRSQSGAALGRNATIRIRGAGSLRDREPLYVVDGTPVTESNDFNPDDIETMNVLKGPAATALYGQRAEGGVIMITTKKGTRGDGMGITINQNLFVDKVYVLPQYQNSYAGGSYADLQQFNYQPGMPAEWQSLDGAYYHDYIDDASWGPRMVGQQYIPWYAWVPGTKYTGKTTALVGQPDNIRDFFETGVNRTTNVSFSKAFDNSNFRVSYTNQGQTGIMPNTSMAKNTLAAAVSANLSKLITVGANINYVATTIKGEFDDQYSNQSTGSFNQWFHRNLDMNIMRELSGVKTPEGRLVSWNHFNPNAYLSQGDKFYGGYYWHNHLAYFENIDYETDRSRLFGDVNITFNITDKLKAQGFYRKNYRSQVYENKRPTILPYSFYTGLRPTTQPQWDFYGTGQAFLSEDNIEGLLTYSTKAANDDLAIDIAAGGNIRNDELKTIDANTTNGLVVPDLFTIANSKGPNQINNFRARKQVRSIYARATLGFKETVFIDGSVRNDWSSALPEGANSYMYPSVGATFIFSELTESAIPVLSFGKIRAGWAQTGSDPDAYSTQLAYGVGQNQWNGNALMGTPNVLIDPNLKPSLSSSTEFGVDLKFLQDRIGLSATYFMESRKDEILTVGITGSSGYTGKTINAGQIDRSGIELALTATPVKTNDFSWDMTLNFAKINTEVVALAEGITAVPSPTGNATFGVGNSFHVVGKSWAQIRGISIQKNDAGVPIVDANGLFVPTDDPVDFGSALPDFTGGFINTLSYKGINVQFNIDYQSGGKFFSLSDMWGTFSGLTARTAGVNDKGIPVRDPVEEGGGVHVVGVTEDGEAVDTYVGAQDYYHQFYNSNIADPHIYDLSFVKLRELSIGYQIPVKSLGSVGNVLKSASISLVGRNLWLISTNVKDFDPSEIAQGFGENGQLPSVRSYGFNLKLGF